MAAILTIMLVLLGGQLAWGVNPQDEGQLLTYPWLIARGVMPYHGIWMSYPPAIYALLALLQRAGGPGLVDERGVGLLAILVYVLLINRLLSASWTRVSWIGLISTFSLVFLSGDVRAYPWTVGMPLLALGLVLGRRHPIVAAAVFLVAGTVRFEYGLAGFVALALMAVLPMGEGQSRARYVLAATSLAIALASVFLLLGALTQWDALRQIFYDQVVAIEPHRRLPLFPPPISVLGAPIALTALGIPFVLIGLGAFGRRPWIIASNLATATLIPHFLQRADFTHLLGLAAITVPWALVTLPQVGRIDARPRAATFTLGWTTATAGAWPALLTLAYTAYISPLSPLGSETLYDARSRFVSAGARSVVATSAREARDDREVIGYIRRHGTVRDRVYIAPLSLGSAYVVTYLYYPLGLRPCGRHLEMQAGVQTTVQVQREIIAALRKCTWIIQVHGGSWYYPPAGTRPSAAPLDRYIASHYRPVLSNRDYAVLRRVQSR